MEILIVGAILMFILIYNNTIDKNKFFADNQKYLELIREEDYTFLVYAKYGEDADADQLYMKRVTFALVMFFIVLAFSMSGGSSLNFVNSQFFLNLVLSTVVAFFAFKISYFQLKNYYKAHLHEIDIMLPYYLKSLEILIQHYTVPVALGRSIETAPEIFKPGLQRLVDKINEGVSVARNTAIQQGVGKYILPLDADDKIAETYLEKTVGYLTLHPEVKVVCTNTRLFGAKNTNYDLPEYDYRRMICRNVLVCTALFRKKDFDKTSGYNPQMVKGLEDWDFWLSFLKEDDVVYRIDEYLFYYRMKYESRNRSSFRSYSRIREQIWENHKEIYANYFFNPVESDEYQTLINSKEYKIGKMLSPILNMKWCYYLLGFIKRNGRKSTN